MELARNRIGQEGALVLVEALQQAPLVSLGLVENGLSDEIVARMMQLKPKMSVLQMSIIDTHASSVCFPNHVFCCCSYGCMHCQFLHFGCEHQIIVLAVQ
jgi:hypothetical protein